MSCVCGEYLGASSFVLITSRVKLVLGIRTKNRKKLNLDKKKKDI